MTMLANQLNWAKKVPNSEELCHTINEFLGIMEEVMDFIREWLENWTNTYEFNCDGLLVPGQYILVATQRTKQSNWGTNLIISGTDSW